MRRRGTCHGFTLDSGYLILKVLRGCKMNFKFTEEQEMMRKMTRDFVDNEVVPYALGSR